VYRRTVQIDKATGWIQVEHEPERHALKVEVSASLSTALGAVQSRLRRLFDLDARPDLIDAKLGTDPLLAPVIKQHPGLRVGGAWDGFELAVRAVLGQQITVKAATTLSARIAEQVGRSVSTPFSGLHRLSIAPLDLIRLGEQRLRGIGVVSARARTLIELAEFAARGGLQFGPGTEHAAVVATLVKLPGIGPWTANYIAMRALRYPDAFPAADLGLRKAVGQGRCASTQETEARSEAWRPWRAYAAAALWKSLG
jgi:AraC family transcriptional regulator, regulatory protein of adaptative response / DNA-3-methyladenine glycosylase II